MEWNGMEGTGNILHFIWFIWDETLTGKKLLPSEGAYFVPVKVSSQA